MAGSYRVDPDLQLVLLEITGETNIQEVLSIVAAIRREISPYLDVLIDLSGITKSEVTPAQMKELAREPNPENPRRIAFVAVRPDVYGRARAYQLVFESRSASSNVGVFHTKAEAMKWLRPSARSAAT